MSWLIYLLVIIPLCVIVFIVYKAIPRLRIIDVLSILKERERKVKENIIFSKIQRTGGVKVKRLAGVFSELILIISKYGRRTVQKLYRLEQYYQKLKRSAQDGSLSYSDETIRQRLDVASELIRQSEFIPAEKIYIDIISHNPRSVISYEALGNMYIKSEQYEQARETLMFALRLSPDDASVNVSIAEIEMKLGNAKSALPYFKKAVEKRPKNPRYLDYYIESALRAGSLKDARLGITTLKDVNPENQKITELEERFSKLKDEYIAKTQTNNIDASQKE